METGVGAGLHATTGVMESSPHPVTPPPPLLPLPASSPSQSITAHLVSACLAFIEEHFTTAQRCQVTSWPCVPVGVIVSYERTRNAYRARNLC